MGVWGSGTFDNDDASDWLYALEGSTGHELLESTLRAAAAPEGYLEAPTCCEALAAAEIIAAIRGWSHPALPPEASRWARAEHRALPPELTALAVAAIDRIEHDSELKELWVDPEGSAEWRRALTDLRRRLAAEVREPLTARRAVAMGHAVITLPATAALLALSWLLWGSAPAAPLTGILVAWLWWSFAVPRWRHWALSGGTDPDALQSWAQATGLVWPRGWIFEKTEIPYRPSRKLTP